MILRGRAWRFGDDVNTDLIMPGKYLELVDPGEMAPHVMEGLEPGFAGKIEEGDIVVAGANFGCGSSREQAPLALKYAGVGGVVAESFARIFYRNAINIGLLALECPGVSEAVREGDTLKLDLTAGVVSNEDTGACLGIAPMPDFLVEVLREGGLVPYMRRHIEEW